MTSVVSHSKRKSYGRAVFVTVGFLMAVGLCMAAWLMSQGAFSKPQLASGSPPARSASAELSEQLRQLTADTRTLCSMARYVLVDGHSPSAMPATNIGETLPAMPTNTQALVETNSPVIPTV